MDEFIKACKGARYLAAATGFEGFLPGILGRLPGWLRAKLRKWYVWFVEEASTSAGKYEPSRIGNFPLLHSSENSIPARARPCRTSALGRQSAWQIRQVR